MDIICIEDAPSPAFKRRRCSLSRPDTSSDMLLALQLQSEEDEKARVEQLLSLAEPAILTSPLQEATELHTARDRPSPRLKEDVVTDVTSSGGCRVKVYTSEVESTVFQLKPTVKLTEIFSEPSVAQALRSQLGVKRLAAKTLAQRFEIHCPAPNAQVFAGAIAGTTSLHQVLGAKGGVLRLRPVGGSLKQSTKRSGGSSSSSRSQRSGVAMAARGLALSRQLGGNASVEGECDTVEVLRLRKPGSDFGSPVVLVKNFNRDRGVLLARLTDLKEMVEMAPDARKKINNNVRNEIDSHHKTRKHFTSEVRRASDRVLDLAFAAVQADGSAGAALSHRTEYASTAVLVYEKGTTLPRHVDGCGHWVVLLSFGVTVQFYAGDCSFKFESGDALVFNGSTPHAVSHGIDKINKSASFRGKNAKLPDELSYLADKRASLQARQADP
eukprot:TRINITY_DN108089_c0_g1_i1.p1 TRINITY_DN108089_c0_g1~~TRINITY_DN108089_c0_g1_i1.p1  ORF type:complete len:449 (+),score=78.14 TRINITY_DN108089_c0_g1_i1:27-1349(+)